MGAIVDMAKSERGVAFVVYLAILTVMMFTDRVTPTAWNEQSLYALGIYIGGKTATGVAVALSPATKKSTPAAPASPPADPEVLS
mgnify:CR=1 FL=1